MTLSQSAFSELKQEEKVNLIAKTSPQLLSILWKDISTFSTEDLDVLYRVSNLESTAKGLVKMLSENLLQVATNFTGPVEESIKKLKLTDEEKGIVDSIYKQTILVAIQRAADNLYKSLQKGDGRLYNAILSEAVVDILDSVLDFKKKIDKHFPGLSDKIISAAAPAIVALASTYSPPLGLALKSTGVLTQAAKFMQTKNLESTINKMREDLAEIKNDQQLTKMQETGAKISELAEQIEVSPVSLGKLGLTLESVTETIKEVATNPDSKALLQAVCKYAYKHTPSNEKEVDKNFAAVKDATLQKLKKHGVSETTIKEVTKILDEAIDQAKGEMQNALKPDSKIFDKITSVQQSADILMKTEKKITAVVAKNHPENQKLIASTSKNLAQEVSTHIRGNVAQVAKHLTSTTKAKQFAKELLGAGLANEVALKRSVQTKSTVREM